MASIDQSNTTTGTKKKADAFINVHAVSSKDNDSKKSLGGIPLYTDNPFHKALLEHLKGGGEVNLETSIHIVETDVKFDF